jgi:hypothetical protein
MLKKKTKLIYSQHRSKISYLYRKIKGSMDIVLVKKNGRLLNILE